MDSEFITKDCCIRIIHKGKQIETPVSTLDLRDCIYLIADLPFSGLLDFHLETENEQIIWNALKHGLKAKSIWLRHLVLAEALSPEIMLDGIHSYESVAKFSKALLELVTAVHRWSLHDEIRSFNSPAQLWLECEIGISRFAVEFSGLIGSPLLIAKRQGVKVGIPYISKLEDLEVNLGDSPAPFFEAPHLVLKEALALARADTEFETLHFRPFLKAKKQLIYKSKKRTDLQFYYLLPTGKLFITGSKKHLPRL
jgi:hypothetical protein